jgi:hypothetical protein
MATFEEIRTGARVRGLDTVGTAEIVQVTRFGADVLNLVFRVNGRVSERLVYRGDEAGFECVETGRTYGFDADGGLLRLAFEAYRLRLAHLFDPYLAVSASQIAALPHQIAAVYVQRQPGILMDVHPLLRGSEASQLQIPRPRSVDNLLRAHS